MDYGIVHHNFPPGILRVMESTDADRHHISISQASRLPTWEEVKHVRNKLGKPKSFYAMVLPPEEFYVNLHPYCLHLWEVLAPEEIEIWKGM